MESQPQLGQSAPSMLFASFESIRSELGESICIKEEIYFLCEELACQCRRHKRREFDLWVWKIPWRKAWQPTPVFFAWRIPWAEEPGGLHSIGLQRVGHD